MINVHIEELVLEIEKTKSEIQTTFGMRKRDLERHLGKLYKQMEEFRRLVART